jgi:AI-2 transport protein TqsA
MSNAAEQVVPEDAAGPPPGQPWRDRGGPGAVLQCLVIAAAAWFLLKELAGLLRPLFLAVFLAYVILPAHLYLMGQARGVAGHLVVLVVVGLLLVVLALVIYGSAVEFSNELPHLHQRTQEVVGQASRFAEEYLPWLADVITGTARAEERGAERLREALGTLVNLTAGVLVEALQVGFFLFFLLLEARHFPGRVRGAFADGRAERILAVVGSINAAMASYLKVKVKASLVLALPVMLILWAFGVKFVVLWGALTFFANFIPYLGSIVACTLPILFGFLELDFGLRTVIMALLLVAVHAGSAYLVEPAMTGKAVNLSPLVILMALSFWGLCWGLAGMVLAVPLTVMLKIVLENVESTRPFARLMTHDS